MKRFRYRISRKVTVWVDDYVEFKAASKEEADEYIKEHAEDYSENGYPSSVECYSTLWDFESIEYITEEENGGNPVIGIEFISDK